MKLDSLLAQLENIKAEFESSDFEQISEDHRSKIILQLLLDYINNPKVEEAVNDIPF